jgi:hypothetical protein
MTYHEQERIYELQVYLHAVKECEMCHEVQRVAVFGGWFCQPCQECDAQVRRARHAWR